MRPRPLARSPTRRGGVRLSHPEPLPGGEGEGELFGFPVGPAQAGDGVVGGQVVDDGGAGAGEGAGGGKSTADLASAAPEGVRLEVEQVRELLALALSQAVEQPLVERLVDPAGAGAARVVREAAGAEDSDALGAGVGDGAQGLAERVAARGGGAGREVGVDPERDD